MKNTDYSEDEYMVQVYHLLVVVKRVFECGWLAVGGFLEARFFKSSGENEHR